MQYLNSFLIIFIVISRCSKVGFFCSSTYLKMFNRRIFYHSALHSAIDKSNLLSPVNKLCLFRHFLNDKLFFLLLNLVNPLPTAKFHFRSLVELRENINGCHAPKLILCQCINVFRLKIFTLLFFVQICLNFQSSNMYCLREGK